MALISEAKRQANRRNAQRSTGPRTAEGRQAVRLNAVKHGLTAATSVLPQEDGAEFAALLADLEARFAPRDEAERDAVRELAQSTWRKRRGGKVEAVVLQALIAKEEAGELTADDALSIPTLLLRISRYEGQHDRAWDRAFARLRLLRTIRPERAAEEAPADRAESVAPGSEERSEGVAAPSDRSASPQPSGACPGPRPQGESLTGNPRIPAEFGFVSSHAPPTQRRAA